MINKPFAEIEAVDISYLVQEGIQEGRTLEYKESLPGNSDRDKKEFLADVSAFANASGGEILYGVTEKRNNDGRPTGVPEAAQGLSTINADAEIQRLENIIRNGIEPRIAVQIASINGFSDGPVLIIRIRKSWTPPHMVTFKNSSRFYSRNSAGKYQLDVTEIRSAFVAAEALPERIRRFRDERVANIIADETPVLLLPYPRIILHVIPIPLFSQFGGIDITQHLQNQQQWPSPIGQHTSNMRRNFDGLLTVFEVQDGFADYVQVFRNGIVEAVDALILEPRY